MDAAAKALPQIAVISPFPLENLPELWEWLNEFPERNFDDSGPRDYDSFLAVMQKRVETEFTFGVFRDGVLSGFIGFAPQNERLGSFHGIVFPQRAWGRATTEVALRRVIAALFSLGFEKLVASYFSDNEKIDRFFTDLGAVQEGYLRKHTCRKGQLVDMKLVAIFKGDN